MPVDVTVLNAGLADSVWRVNLQIDIADGWHIQSQEAELPYHPTSIRPFGELNVIEVAYPQSHVFHPAFETDSLSVYSGREHIDLILKIPPGTTRRKLTLSYQACDDTRCLPPAEVTVDLEMVTIPTVNGTRSRTN